MRFDISALPTEAHTGLQWFQIMADAAPVMIWMSGLDKRTFYFNKPWLEFTGRTLEQEPGIGWSEVLHPDDVERCLTTYATAFDARVSFELECRQRRCDGEWRTVLGRGKPMYGPNGEFLGYIGSCIDVTERRRAEDFRERLLVAAIRDFAIYWLTPEGRVASWNAGAERLKGYRAEEIVGQHFGRFFPEEDVQLGKPDALLRVAAAEGRAETQGWRVRKDQSRFWADVVVTAIRDASGQLQGFAKVTRDVTERKQLEDEILRRAQQLASLSAEHMEIVGRVERLREQRHEIERQRLLDDERKRIARDLHDGVEQAFFGIGLAVSAARAELSDGEAGGRLQTALAQITELAMDGVDRLHEAISAVDHAEVAGRRLVPSLSRLAVEFRQRTGVEADVVVTGAKRRLPTIVAETLYASALEALWNVERHSNARTVVLGLHIDRREVTLSVQDDGAGAPSVPIQRHASETRFFGLHNVGQRVLGLKGSLDAGPNPDGGFSVRTRLPLGDDSAA
jgi:PAS domain S-box-containing protein